MSYRFRKTDYSFTTALFVGRLLSKGEATQEQYASAEWYTRKMDSRKLLNELGYDFKSAKAIYKALEV